MGAIKVLNDADAELFKARMDNADKVVVLYNRDLSLTDINGNLLYRYTGRRANEIAYEYSATQPPEKFPDEEDEGRRLRFMKSKWIVYGSYMDMGGVTRTIGFGTNSDTLTSLSDKFEDDPDMMHFLKHHISTCPYTKDKHVKVAVKCGLINYQFPDGTIID